MAQRLVLDCDTGTVDAVAIMLAALGPAPKLDAVTTVDGNVEVQYATDNSLRVLDYIGCESVPVYEGAASPLARNDFPVPRAVLPSHNNNPAYLMSLDLPAATSAKRPEAAAAFLVRHFRAARANGQDVVLVAVGPLTNVALALKLDRAFASNLARLVIMGGGHMVPNETASAELYIWADPEAAAVVLESGIDEVVLPFTRLGER
jgi:inosine-uridine nucleoside N-ribohydrolase